MRWTSRPTAATCSPPRFLIMATGCLSIPRMPTIQGLERFAGETYHTGLWPHEPVDFRGKRVGIIGTGSSAVQALPIIAEDAAQVTIFQRTPAYSVPAWNAPAHGRRGPRAQGTLRRVPPARARVGRWQPVVRARAERVRGDAGGAPERSSSRATASAASSSTRPTRTCSRTPRRTRSRPSSCATRSASASHDPETAELLCPYEYPFATKRMCIDTDYYEAYNRDNVRLVSVKETPIERDHRARTGGRRRGARVRHPRPRDRLRRDDRRAARGRHPRPDGRPLAAREVGETARARTSA